MQFSEPFAIQEDFVYSAACSKTQWAILKSAEGRYAVWSPASELVLPDQVPLDEWPTTMFMEVQRVS